MTSEQEEIFREIILDHHKRPRNQGELAGASHQEAGSYADTGDAVELSVLLEGDVVSDLRFKAQGSAVLMASCSLMTVFAKGKTAAEVTAGIGTFLSHLENQDSPIETLEPMGDLIALSGIRQFPARVKCASLPWRTLQALLEKTPL